MKTLVRDLTPPLVWRGAVKLRGGNGAAIHRAVPGAPAAKPTVKPDAKPGVDKFGYGVEQPPEFYDATFENAEHWKQHYTASHYYSLWTVIADRVRRAGVRRVLDIGCGPGQVACLLRDLGVSKYIGLDFSPARVAQAKAVCPEYEFVEADAFKTELFETFDYDCVLTMEFLEHVERDLEVLDRVRPGALVVATVPNFPNAGHVRHFKTAAEVEARYRPHFATLEVTPRRANEKGRTYFILEGRR